MNRFPLEGGEQKLQEDLMHRLGERLISCAPLLLVLAGACSSDETTVLGVTPTGVGGSTVVVSTADASITVTPTPAVATVTIPVGAQGQGPAAYGVNPLVVSTGTTVTWVNGDGIPHTSTSDTGVWDSGILSAGQSFSFTFAQAGTYPYHCAIHGVASMSGTIVVQ
jgi:plastocyanin